MGLQELFRQTFANLRANRLRSLLTMFGILWGIVSIILMNAMGTGMMTAQRQKTRALGQNLIIVWGGLTTLQSETFQAGRRIRLTFDDYLAVREECRLLSRISPEFQRGSLTSRTPLNSGVFQTHGVYPEYQQIRTIELDRGRLMNDRDNSEGRRICLIGSEVRDQLFKEEDPLGRTIHIQNLPYTVVGLLLKKDQNSNYSGPDNKKIFIPFSSVMRDFPNPLPDADRNVIDQLIVQPRSVQDSEGAEIQIRQVLGRRQHFDVRDEDALKIWNTITTSRMVLEIFDSMGRFLTFVGIITLALGGLGVTNIMLVSVRERTREIGIRKAVGATRRSILLQFFSEAMAITLSAGAGGLLLAWTICALVNTLPKLDFFAGLIVSPATAMTAVGGLVLIGLLSGIYPAMEAAEMDPIEALRYE